MRTVEFERLGLIEYGEAWAYQEKLFAETAGIKMLNRGEPNPAIHVPTVNRLLFCEHPHVYTLGKSGHDEFLLLDADGLAAHNATYFRINRGGDITYHGPGQLVAYPIFDLDHFFTDIHRYLRTLEEAVILTLEEYGIKSGRINAFTGVWVDFEDPVKARKICALGVKCSRWVTMHGLALNVNTDLSYFGHIIPCGIKDKDVTSLERELGQKVDIHGVEEKLKINLANLFDFDFT